jgi:hypothetical protein
MDGLAKAEYNDIDTDIESCGELLDSVASQSLVQDEVY